MANEETQYMSNKDRKPDNNFESANEAANKFGRKGKEMMSDIASGAQKLGGNIMDKADGAISSVGGKITNLADSLRENAPSSGTLGAAAETVAGSLESSGKYLSSHGISEMGSDMSQVIRKYPWTSIGVGVGVGMLLGAACSRR